MNRDAALDSRSRVGPTGQLRPDRQRPGTLGGHLGHGTESRPGGSGQTARHAALHGGGALRPRHHHAGRRRAWPQQSDGPHDRADQHRRDASAHSPHQRIRRYTSGRRRGPSRHPRERVGHRARFRSQPEFQRQARMHGLSGRSAVQRSGGTQRAAGHGGRRKPILPWRDRPSHRPRNRPAQHLHLERRGPDRAGGDSRTRHDAVLLLAGRRRCGGGRRRRGPGHLRRLHHRRRALHQRNQSQLADPAGGAPRGQQADGATAAARAPWRVWIAMCSASRGSSG